MMLKKYYRPTMIFRTMQVLFTFFRYMYFDGVEDKSEFNIGIFYRLDLTLTILINDFHQRLYFPEGNIIT